MQKVNKKVGGMFSEIRSRKIGNMMMRGLKKARVMGISEVGLPKIKAVMMGMIFIAIFAAVWAVMPANGAEAAFGRNFRI